MSRLGLSLRICMPLVCLVSMSVFGDASRCARAADKPVLQLKHGDKIVLIGNSLAERMQYFNHWETLLKAGFPNSN